eukprot:TRINITY_DN2419_c1_g2_i1.p4 TRINITY_DN2419_c1_g2~~TRINITY_DN2419_c1_g2_i1.p4  ORF type:complete len:121 (+),score=9.77 TRINITY_DN2419_c1_g2_i1:260-622(+)
MKRHMRNKWKGAIGTVMAVNRLNQLIEGIKEGSLQSGHIVNDIEGYQSAVEAVKEAESKQTETEETVLTVSNVQKQANTEDQMDGDQQDSRREQLYHDESNISMVVLPHSDETKRQMQTA